MFQEVQEKLQIYSILQIQSWQKVLKNVKKLYKWIKKNKKRLSKSSSIKPDDFIERFCNKLNIPQNEIKLIQNICQISIDNNLICENTPPSIAAGCIFYYSKLKNKELNKKNISEICKISEVTINKCMKKIGENEELFTNI